MIYRQKVLLAVVEAFGGDLSHTDLEKLLFLYCKYVGINHYDFFPYRYGAFSIMSYYDKQKLINSGMLQSMERFRLSTKKSFINSLEIRDRAALRSFVRLYQGIRGGDLIRKTYLEYPEFASRSEIAKKELTAQEYSSVSEKWNTDASPALFTIGYEGITIDEYLNRLILNNVQILVDVRKNPLSHKYGFSKTRLQEWVKNAKIEYVHLPELGIPSHLRQNLSGQKAYDDLFEYYAAEMLPQQSDALGRIQQMLLSSRVALTCFETDPTHCHRHKIVDKLLASSKVVLQVNHL